jgi:hypothetical protein
MSEALAGTSGDVGRQLYRTLAAVWGETEDSRDVAAFGAFEQIVYFPRRWSRL